MHNLHSGCLVDISQHRIQSSRGIRTWRRSLQSLVRLSKANGLPRWLSGKKSTCNADVSLDSWDWEIPWRRTWQSSQVFLPGKSHGQRSLVGYSPQGCTRQAHLTHTFCSPIHNVTPPSCFKRLDHGGRLNLSDSFLWEFGVRVPKHIEHTPALGEGQAN